MGNTLRYFAKLGTCLTLVILFTFRSVEPAIAAPLLPLSVRLPSASLVSKATQPPQIGFIPIFLVPELVELFFGVCELIEGVAAVGTAQQATGAVGVGVGVGVAAAAVDTEAVTVAYSAGSKVAKQVVSQGVRQVATAEAKQVAKQIATVEAKQVVGKIATTETKQVVKRIYRSLDRPISDYTIGSGLTGVWHPPTKQWRAVPSGEAKLRSGLPLNPKSLDKRGGHKGVEEQLAEMLGIEREHPENVGFSLTRKDERTLKIGWNSTVINARNNVRRGLKGRAASREHRDAIKKAIERETGLRVIESE